jgi:hypothetical protein
MSKQECGIEIQGLRRSQFPWLRAALRHLGYPPAGWSSEGIRRRPSMVFTCASAARVSRVIEQLWENERPGYPITIHRLYG